MLNEEWKVVTGMNTTDDDNSSIAARKTADGSVSIAYPAYGGIKIVTLTGVPEFADKEVSSEVFDNQMSIIRQSAGDDWEAMFFIISDGIVYAAYVDDCNIVTVVPSNDMTFNGDIDVDESLEFDTDEFCDVDEDLLRLFGYMAD